MSLVNYPTIRPSLILDFQKAEAVDPRITFTRATTATRFNSYGVLESVADNVPRIDYDPSTLQPRGLLIEEQRTNSIRNNTMQGAVAGTPGTLPTNWSGLAATNLTREVVGTGTENGINYIDVKYTGTVSASRTQHIFFEPNNQIAASNGQSWTGSAWVKIVAGSLTNITSVGIQADTRDASLVYVSTPFNQTFTPTSTFTRYSASGTATGATIAWIQPFIRFVTASTGAIDITLRVGLPQMELGAFATSVIPTTTTALTRNADVATMTGTNFSSWYNAAQGTLFGQYQTLTAGTTQFLAAITSVSEADRITVGQTTTAYVGSVVDTSVSQASITQGTTSLNSAKIVFTYKINDFAFSLNGAAPGTDTVGTVPAGVTEMKIGRRGTSTSPLNGWVARLAYYPTRLPNATLQALTV